MSILEIEEGFCWDHGFHLGARCLRCRPEIGEHAFRNVLTEQVRVALGGGISKNAA